jgi:magnesium transporter
MDEQTLDEQATAEVKARLLARRWDDLRSFLAEQGVPEIADLLRELTTPERGVLFRLVPRHLASEVFSALDAELRDKLLKDLTDEETRQLLADLTPDDRTQVLEELPGQVTQRLLNLLGPEDLREARWLLGYPEQSAGRLMTPEYVALRARWTIAQALEHVRAKGPGSETLDVLYVTDTAWRLLGVVPLRQLILSAPTATVEQVMQPVEVRLSPFDDREHAVHMMRRYDVPVLPVVNAEGVLLGIVTVDDVLDVAEEEATEDFHKTAAVQPLAASYRASGVWALYRRRVGWLLGLVVANLVSSGIIAAYEETLAAAVALAFFIPLLIDSGGNVGTQSATMMIRALATGDLVLAQWARTMLKELGIGAALGVTMGIGGTILGVLRGGIEIGVVVGLSMFLIVMMTNALGVTLPFVLTRVGLDPAVASSPLITSIADSIGLLSYFVLATWLLTVLAAI